AATTSSTTVSTTTTAPTTAPTTVPEPSTTVAPRTTEAPPTTPPAPPTTAACTPAPLPPAPTWGTDPTRYDPAPVQPARALIDPDIVLVVLGASGDLVAGEDPPFHSPEATALRRAEAGRALDLLTSQGARVVWVLPAVPLPEATFFCGGRIPDSPCDPTWV